MSVLPTAAVVAVTVHIMARLSEWHHKLQLSKQMSHYGSIPNCKMCCTVMESATSDESSDCMVAPNDVILVLVLFSLFFFFCKQQINSFIFFRRCLRMRHSCFVNALCCLELISKPQES